MYSISANTMYSIDENGKHSLEISYQDSDGTNVGAYAEGDKFENVLLDAIDQIDEAIAENDDARADKEEAAQIQAQIDDLTKQLEELKARNAELQHKSAKIESADRYANLENVYNKFAKDFNDSDIFKRWFEFK